jgi:hypothetical protein
MSTEDSDPAVTCVLWATTHENTGRKLRLVETRSERGGLPNLRLELERPLGKQLHINVPGVFAEELRSALKVFRRHRRQSLRDQ